MLPRHFQWISSTELGARFESFHGTGSNLRHDETPGNELVPSIVIPHSSCSVPVLGPECRSLRADAEVANLFPGRCVHHCHKQRAIDVPICQIAIGFTRLDFHVTPGDKVLFGDFLRDLPGIGTEFLKTVGVGALALTEASPSDPGERTFVLMMAKAAFFLGSTAR